MNNDNQLTVNRYRVADQVYDILKEQILKGIFASGEEISIDELTKKLNTSKTPVREALNRLKGEGLVGDTEKGKMKVIELSSREIANICELREVMEVLAMKWGFQNIPRDVIQENLEMLKRSEEDLKKGDTRCFCEADIKLHNLIITSADNKWLTQIISQLRNLIEITRNIFPSLERYKISVGEHKLIVKSILKGDREEAIKYLGSHLKHVKDRLLSSLKQKQEDKKQ